MFTRRGWGLLFACLFGLLLAVFTLNLVAIAVAVFALTFVAGEILLFGRTARALSVASFRIERLELTRRLSAGGFGTTEVRISCPDAPAFFGEVSDSVPEVFEVAHGASQLVTWWPKGRTVTLAYVYRARARGRYDIGPTEVVVHDALGLAFHRIALPSTGEVLVSPIPPEVVLRRSALAIATRTAGQRPVTRQGYGTEFRSLRPYLPGDDYRTIAWGRSRPGQLVVREFEQESRQSFLVLISQERAMGAGNLADTALDHACEAGMLLAHYIPRGGDQIGLYLTASNAPTYIPPGRGAQHSLRFNEALSLATAQPDGPDFGALVRSLPRVLRQPTHVFAFAPIPPRLDTLAEGLGAFRAAGHRLYLFPPDLSGMYPDIESPSRRPFLARAEAQERARGAAPRSVIERLGVPVHSYDRNGTGAHVLALYQQIHNWGVAR